MDVAAFRSRLAFHSIRLGFLAAFIGFGGCASLMKTTATSFLNEIETSDDPNVRFKDYEKLASPRCYDSNEQRARAVKVLLAALNGKREPVATRAVICRTLGSLGDPAAREPMLRLARHSDVLLRSEAMRCLGKVGKPEDATVLMQIMTLDANPDCQVAAIEALGDLKSVDPRTPSYLVQGMENDDPAIRLASYQSLKKITGKDLGVDVKVWRQELAKQDSSKKPAASNTASANPAPSNTASANPAPSLPALPDAASPTPRRQPGGAPTLDASARPASSVYR